MKSILFFVVLLAACNNGPVTEKPSSDSTGMDHSKHAMVSGSADYCDSLNKGLLMQDTLKGSPLRSAMNTIGKTHVHIEYSSPGVKDRTIWGGLVAYDKVWVTGAHKATTIQLYRDVIFAGKTIPKGLYGLFTIPGKDEWTFIINTRYEQHLADDYQEKEDLLRMKVKPVPHAFTPRLDFTVNAIDDKDGEIVIAWDKLAVNIPFSTTP
ncbi:MAG: DUF2911 domain-containing protein [Chitinophagaceae bacterium]|nr:MAG: DUF2911 domain-containing protein [Chitinophagaceae bacterium]